MAHGTKIDQHFAPSKVILGGSSPQAVTRRQIELESCSNPLKQVCQRYGPRAKTGQLRG